MPKRKFEVGGDMEMTEEQLLERRADHIARLLGFHYAEGEIKREIDRCLQMGYRNDRGIADLVAERFQLKTS